MAFNRLTRADLWVKPQLLPEAIEAGLMPAITELTRLYEGLVPLFAPQVLVAPVIVVESCGRAKGKLGHYAHKSWRRAGRDDARVDEIMMVSEYLGRDVYNIAETLVHEMVHQADWQAGVKDCTVNQYHNKRFKQRAESVGLVVRPQPPRGFAHTELSDELRAAIGRLDPRADAFSLFRAGGVPLVPADAPPDREPPQPKLLKYRCGCRGWVWLAAGRPCDLFCKRCNRDLKRPELLP